MDEERVQRLYKEFNYKNVLYLGGFVKTTLSATLITLGVTFILNGLSKHPFLLFYLFPRPDSYRLHELSISIGVVALAAACMIVYSIDKYRERYKKKEIGIICHEIDKKAEEIAKEKIKEALEKISKNGRKS